MKNRWNKVLALLLVLVCVGVLGGCGDSENGNETTGGAQNSPAGEVQEPTAGANDLVFTQTENAGEKVTIPGAAGGLPENNETQKETEEKQPETNEAQKETQEKQPETTAEPETEGNQSGGSGSNVGNGKYAPMAEADFNTAVANSVTTVTVNFGPELKFYLDANFAILAVEALEWQAEWIVGEEKYVYLPMQFGEGLADVTVKGWDMLIGGIGIEQMTLTIETKLTDVEAMRDKYYQEINIMGEMSNQLVAKKSHRFMN